MITETARSPRGASEMPLARRSRQIGQGPLGDPAAKAPRTERDEPIKQGRTPPTTGVAI